MYFKLPFLFLALFLSFATQALATNIVSTPYIRKDVLGFQYRSTYDLDSDNTRADNNQPSRFVVNYGVTNNLRFDFRTSVSNPTHQDAKISGFESVARWKFLDERKNAPLTVALDGNYIKNTTNTQSNRFELKLIAGKNTPKILTIANISAGKEVGRNNRPGITLKFAWHGFYKLHKHFMPGVNIFSSSGNLEDKNSFQEQSHQIGPAFTGNIFDNFSYDITYLYGASRSAIDHRVRLIIFYSKKI